MFLTGDVYKRFNPLFFLICIQLYYGDQSVGVCTSLLYSLPADKELEESKIVDLIHIFIV